MTKEQKSAEEIAREIVERLAKLEGESRPFEEWETEFKRIGECFIDDIAQSIREARARNWPSEDEMTQESIRRSTELAKRGINMNGQRGFSECYLWLSEWMTRGDGK